MMKNVRSDLLKEIEKTVKDKRILAKTASVEKTVARWVSDFFIEYEKIKNIDSHGTLTAFAMNRLTSSLKKVDKKCCVVFKAPVNEEPSIEIRWSTAYGLQRNCETILVFDASNALFQAALEDF